MKFIWCLSSIKKPFVASPPWRSSTPGINTNLPIFHSSNNIRKYCTPCGKSYHSTLFQKRWFATSQAQVHPIPSPSPSSAQNNLNATKKRNKQKKLMRKTDDVTEDKECYGFCVSESLDLSKLKENMKNTNELQDINPEEPNRILRLQLNAEKYVYYFRDYGVVCWGLDKTDRDKVIKDATTIANKPKDSKIEHENFRYLVSPSKREGVFLEKDRIHLSEDTKLLEMLIYSHGIARAVKLDYLEAKVESEVTANKTLSSVLIKKGRVPIWTWDHKINSKMGTLLQLRSLLNHSELGDEPDECWEDKHLQDCYNSIERELEIKGRIGKLNAQLTHAKETIDDFKFLLSSRHSSRLEWIIIFLIFCEIIFQIEDRGFFIDYWLPYPRFSDKKEEEKEKEKEEK